MMEELDTLEAKLAQLLERYLALRSENLRLRQQVIGLENTNKALSDRVAEARDRMESLFNKIPD